MKKSKRLTGSALMAAFIDNATLQAEIFEDLRRHLKQGLSIDCFGPLSDTSIRECVKLYPDTWSEDALIETLREAKSGWETIGRRQADGSCMGNSRSWYYNMSNRYGWSDRQQVETKGTQQLNVNIVSYAAPDKLKDSVTQG